MEIEFEGARAAESQRARRLRIFAGDSVRKLPASAASRVSAEFTSPDPRSTPGRGAPRHARGSATCWAVPARFASVEESLEILRSARRIAVLGIKPESRKSAAGYWVPDMLQRLGYAVFPVPVRYPEVTEILGRPVVRDLRDLPVAVDIVNVFRKPEEVAGHLEELLAVRPPVVWFQSGCLDFASAEALVAAGIVVVHDCIACRRATIQPSFAPLPGQSAG